MKKNYPVIVGVGQVTDRRSDYKTALHPLELSKLSVDKAVDDCECRNILKVIDLVSVVNMISWNYGNPPACLSEILQIKPEYKEYSTMGGNTPQYIINKTADRIARGEIKAALITGAEAFYTVGKARKEGHSIRWPRSADPEFTEVGDPRGGTNAIEGLHSADRPINIYPLFENALRYEKGISIEEHRNNLGEFCAGYSRIAASDPYAWFREERSPEQIKEVTDDNRMICFPYTKYMNSVLSVNQAASVILTGTETARKLNIPEYKWVYLHGGADAADTWFVSERSSYTYSPALKEIADKSLEMAGIGREDIDFFDLYTCFPSAAIIGAKSIGLDLNNLPPLTITGGLMNFGGPGNNYVMHSIAHAVERLRKNQDKYGFVSGVGWYLTKHSAGIYSRIEPSKEWECNASAGIQERINNLKYPLICEKPDGTAAVETYTVVHHRSGEPMIGIVAARLEDGRRCWACTEKDTDLFRAMETDEFIGRSGKITLGDKSPNIIRF